MCIFGSNFEHLNFFCFFGAPLIISIDPIPGGQAKSRGTKSRAEAGAGAGRRNSWFIRVHGSASNRFTKINCLNSQHSKTMQSSVAFLISSTLHC